MEKCVDGLVNNGEEKSNAIAICHNSIVGKKRKKWRKV